MNRADILYLVHRTPYPPDKGDRIRTYHILRFLSRHVNLHLACLADEPVQPEEMAALQALCQRVAVVPLRKTRWLRALGSMLRGRSITTGAFSSPALRDVLRCWNADTPFRAALASSSSMVPYLQMPKLRHIPAVIDLIDVDSQKWLDYAHSKRGPRSWLYRLEGRRLRKLEQSLPAWTRGITLVSEAEADLYRRFSTAEQVHTVTNGVDLDYFQPRPEVAEEPACVFVGALDYYPNIDAACWFCREVWPAIQRRQPQARMLLVGRNPAPAVRQLVEVPGVEVVGQVPDVRPYVARAAVSVTPLRIARGLQNKVLEALAMSKAVIAAPQALAALGTVPGTHLLSASSPAEWEYAVVQLLQDANQRRQLGSAGRAYVEENHNWDTCLEPLLPLLDITESYAACGAAQLQQK